MGKVPVHFCQSNLAAASERIRLMLIEDFDEILEIHEAGCLGVCQRCDEKPYCYLAGMLFEGQDPDELWERLASVLRRALGSSRSAA